MSGDGDAALDSNQREQARTRALIDDLRALPAEAAWAEFKENYTDPEMIGKLISALSNAARLADQHFAYVVYQHAALKYVSGDRMTNATLRERFGIAERNASQASGVIRLALDGGLIRAADPEHPRAGYVPYWG